MALLAYMKIGSRYTGLVYVLKYVVAYGQGQVAIIVFFDTVGAGWGHALIIDLFGFRLEMIGRV